MIAAIMQPAYLPWLGYFDLIDQADVFILLDDVQFAKRSWQQRNRIKTPNGLEWLTIPVMIKGRTEQRINETALQNPLFSRDHLRAIELNYVKTPWYASIADELSKNYLMGSASGMLVDVTVCLIQLLHRRFGIATTLVRSSELHSSGTRTAKLTSLCHAVGANVYLSPMGSAEYLLDERMTMEVDGIEIRFQHFQHPEYHQHFPPFLPYASALDLYMNEGENALDIIRSGRQPSHSADDVARMKAHS